mmetsp:Transcript_5466/g.17490  ORF Transcript_5466/g.17490 Transcript_5466/m.17490 type:complete len:337 (+) Transcript_5466:550-1560(+)
MLVLKAALSEHREGLERALVGEGSPSRRDAARIHEPTRFPPCELCERLFAQPAHAYRIRALLHQQSHLGQRRQRHCHEERLGLAKVPVHGLCFESNPPGQRVCVIPGGSATPPSRHARDAYVLLPALHQEQVRQHYSLLAVQPVPDVHPFLRLRIHVAHHPRVIVSHQPPRCKTTIAFCDLSFPRRSAPAAQRRFQICRECTVRVHSHGPQRLARVASGGEREPVASPGVAVEGESVRRLPFLEGLALHHRECSAASGRHSEPQLHRASLLVALAHQRAGRHLQLHAAKLSLHRLATARSDLTSHVGGGHMLNRIQLEAVGQHVGQRHAVHRQRLL